MKSAAGIEGRKERASGTENGSSLHSSAALRCRPPCAPSIRSMTLTADPVRTSISRWSRIRFSQTAETRSAKSCWELSSRGASSITTSSGSVSASRTRKRSAASQSPNGAVHGPLARREMGEVAMGTLSPYRPVCTLSTICYHPVTPCGGHVFDPDRLPELKGLVREATRGDSGLLDEVMRDVAMLRHLVTTIQPRNTNSISLVASDGGNNSLEFNPFSRAAGSRAGRRHPAAHLRAQPGGVHQERPPRRPGDRRHRGGAVGAGIYGRPGRGPLRLMGEGGPQVRPRRGLRDP